MTDFDLFIVLAAVVSAWVAFAVASAAETGLVGATAKRVIVWAVVAIFYLSGARMPMIKVICMDAARHQMSKDRPADAFDFCSEHDSHVRQYVFYP